VILLPEWSERTSFWEFLLGDEAEVEKIEFAPLREVRGEPVRVNEGLGT